MNKQKKSTTVPNKKSRFERELETLSGSSRSRITVNEPIEPKPVKNVIKPAVEKRVTKRKIVEQNDINQSDEEKPKKKNKVEITKKQDGKPNKMKKPITPIKVEKFKVVQEKEEEKPNKMKKPITPTKVQLKVVQEKEEERPNKMKKPTTPIKVEKLKVVQEEEEKPEPKEMNKPTNTKKEKPEDEQDEEEEPEEEEPEEEKPKTFDKDSFLKYEVDGINKIIIEKNKRLSTKIKVMASGKTLFVKMVTECVQALDYSFEKIFLNQGNKLVTIEQAKQEISKLYPSSLLDTLDHDYKIKDNYVPVFSVDRWPNLECDAKFLVCCTLDKFFKYFLTQACKNTKRYHSEKIEAKNVKYLIGESKSLSEMFPSLNTYVGYKKVPDSDYSWGWRKGGVDAKKI